MSIYKKLSELQSRIIAPKGEYNKHGNFYYRSKENILQATKPICKSLGLVLYLRDDVIYLPGEEIITAPGLSEVAQAGRFYVISVAVLACTETGEKIEVPCLAREPFYLKGMSPAQTTGASSSYAGKYALQNLLGLDDNDEPDMVEPEPAKKAVRGPVKKPANKTSTKKPSKELDEKLRDAILLSVNENNVEKVLLKLQDYKDDEVKETVFDHIRNVLKINV